MVGWNKVVRAMRLGPRSPVPCHTFVLYPTTLGRTAAVVR